MRMAGGTRIGLSCGRSRPGSYYDAYESALRTAGAEVDRILPGHEVDLKQVDGLVIPGGVDVEPSRYGEDTEGDWKTDPELDELEVGLICQAAGMDLPIWGICRGQQVINVALGGTLVQHLDGHNSRLAGLPADHLAHEIEIEPSSKLASVVGASMTRVNSRHHQAVKDVAPGLRVTAWSPDGVVEAVEAPGGRITAVQCHPEDLVASCSWALRLFATIVAETRRRA